MDAFRRLGQGPKLELTAELGANAWGRLMFERLIAGGFAFLMAMILSAEMASAQSPSAQSTSAQSEAKESLPRLPLPIAPENYPVESLIANEQGSVVLRANIGTDGQLSDAQVQTSSGHSHLDEASIFLANDARLPTPPTNAEGEPVSVDVFVDLEWNLPLEPAEEFLLRPELAQGTAPPVQEPDQGRDHFFHCHRSGLHRHDRPLCCAG